MTTDQPTPAPANRSKLLMIIGSAVVVLLAIIAWAVSSQAIRANEEAAAKGEGHCPAVRPGEGG